MVVRVAMPLVMPTCSGEPSKPTGGGHPQSDCGDGQALSPPKAPSVFQMVELVVLPSRREFSQNGPLVAPANLNWSTRPALGTITASPKPLLSKTALVRPL